MEKARQHSALIKLYWLSALLLGGGVALFLVAIAARTPIFGNAVVVMMASGLGSRALFFALLFNAQRSANSLQAKWTGLNAIVMLFFAVGFFYFVVLSQFRAHP